MGDINPAAHGQSFTPRQTSLVDAFSEHKRVLTAIMQNNPLRNAVIDDGDLTIRGGTLWIQETGSIQVEDGGGISVSGGGDIAVSDGGGVTVTGSGDITVSGGGDIRVLDDGTILIQNGGMRVEQRGIIRSGSFNGDLTVGNPGTTGWALGSSRLALLGALVVPVDFYSNFASNNNFGFGSTPNVRTSITVPVPSWADEAGVIAMSMISARNQSASSDSLNGRSRVDGIEGQLFNKTVAVNEIFDVTLGQAEDINVSGRSSFQVDIQVWSGGNAWPANGANNAALSLLVLFRSNG